MADLIKQQLGESKPMGDRQGNALHLGQPTKKKKAKEEVDSDDDLLNDDADYVFMQEYRTKRLEEMTKNQPGAQKSMMSPKKDSIPNHVSLLDHKKEFGTCVETGGEGWFIKEIEEEDENTTIVVHIYEPGIRACELVNVYMEELASIWVHVKFVRLRSVLCGVSVPANKLPLISTYRKGQLLSAIRNIKEELLSGGRDSFTREDFEWLLESSDNWTT